MCNSENQQGEPYPYTNSWLVNLSGLSIADIMALRAYSQEKLSFFTMMWQANPEDPDVDHQRETFELLCVACESEMMKGIIPSVCEGYYPHPRFVEADIADEGPADTKAMI